VRYYMPGILPAAPVNIGAFGKRTPAIAVVGSGTQGGSKGSGWTATWHRASPWGAWRYCCGGRRSPA
jgi:hypothetical protein